MKIIRPGDAKIQNWWYGKQCECERCGQVVELQKGDDQRADWISNQSPDQVTVVCVCGHWLHLSRQ